LFSGGIWTNQDDENFGGKFSGHYCKYPNSLLSTLWKANPEDNGPMGTGVSITFYGDLSYEQFWRGIDDCSGLTKAHDDVANSNTNFVL